MDDCKTLLFDEDVVQGENKRTIYRTEYKYKGVLALVTRKSSETILRGNIRRSPAIGSPWWYKQIFIRQAKFTTFASNRKQEEFLLCNLIFKFSDMKGLLCPIDQLVRLVNWLTFLVQYVNIYHLINWAAIDKWQMTCS
jgi:hypothetical protein